MTYYSVLCFVIFGCAILSKISAQSCNSRVPIDLYHAQPSAFRGTVTLEEHPDRGTRCAEQSVSGMVIDTCLGEVILGDGDTDMEPVQPNLNERNNLYGEISDFMIWGKETPDPYVSIDLRTESTFTAIQLNFLNYPAQNVSLPDIQLRNTISLVDTSTDSGTNIDFVLLGNEDLSQTDYRRTSVTLRLLSQITTRVFLLRWSFTEVYNVDWFFLSEVTICTDEQPEYSAEPILFSSPATDKMILPSAEDLANDVLVLTCAITTRGSFSWVWRQNGTVITTNTKFQTFTADGTRTSKLFINQLSFTDGANYLCEVSHQSSTSDRMMREFQVAFPAYVETREQVNGYLEEQTVTLTCEVHGYLTSPLAPSWLTGSGEEIMDSSKYTIETSTGSNRVWLENGTNQMSIISTLTIHQLNETDEGIYICRTVDGTVVGESESRTMLTIVPGTAPPTTTTSQGGSDTNTSGANAGAIAAGVIIGLLILVLLIAIAIVLLVLFLKKRNDYVRFKVRTPSMKAIKRRLSSISLKKEDLRSSHNGTSNNIHLESSQKKYSKADIEWQLSGSPSEKESEFQVYSVVSKPADSKEKKDEESLGLGDGEPPPIPPQNFDPNDISNAAAAAFEEPNQYADLKDVVPADRRPHRRLTNSTQPKLAKLMGTKTGYGLEFNPIYASTSSLDVSRQLDTVDFTNTYAEPSNPDQSFASSAPDKNTMEPVYSEALTPAMLTQSQEGAPDNDLAPFGPIYAEPLALNKSEEPMKITAGNIEEIRQIGVGQFGEVVLAETIGLSLKDLKLSSTDDNKNIRVQVAVKKLRPDAQNPIREAFDKEIKFMSRLKDDNIVKLLAICTGSTPFIVMEYMENGDLHQFLSQHEPAASDSDVQANQLPPSLLLYMAIQIASGMRYLASLNYVHRDLATRNCLVGKNVTVKIADFGMSRSLYESSYYRVRGRAMLPIRWMASESFYGRFSEKSDVWSFGVVMWEIFTFGKVQPYEELDDQEMIKDAIRTVGRRRLDRPEYCPVEVYEVMVRCWEYAKDARPTFEQIFHSLVAVQKQ